MYRKTIMIGAISMALAVIAGAFSAHALKGFLDERMMNIFTTGVEYQFYHSLGILLIGTLMHNDCNNVLLKRSATIMLWGMIIFCGSLYLIVATGYKTLGMITPIGGILMIIAWLTLAWSQWQKH